VYGGPPYASKGYSCLFQAIISLRREYPEIRLLLVGDGDLRSELEDLSKSLGISENVIFLGSRSDVLEILTVTEIFVFFFSVGRNILGPF